MATGRRMNTQMAEEAYASSVNIL